MRRLAVFIVPGAPVDGMRSSALSISAWRITTFDPRSPERVSRQIPAIFFPKSYTLTPGSGSVTATGSSVSKHLTCGPLCGTILPIESASAVVVRAFVQPFDSGLRALRASIISPLKMSSYRTLPSAFESQSEPVTIDSSPSSYFSIISPMNASVVPA